MLKSKLLGATAAAQALAIEDVFSTYLYTGNGSTQTITNGIDLAGEGGLVWFKARSGTYGASQHALFDTNRGVLKGLASSNTSAEATETGSLTAFNSDGFNLGSWSGVNGTGSPYASWTFRKAPRFFDVVTYTGNGVAGRTVSHNLGIEPGCIIIKNLSLARQWQVYHRSTGNDKELALNNTDPAATTTTFLNSTDPTSTEFTLGTDINANGSGYNYVAYLFAHDPLGPSGDGSDGLIACGSYTGNGSTTNGPLVNLGWEPQWLIIKNASDAYDWVLYDTMRGLTADLSTSANPVLFPNLSNAEGSYADVAINATGFKIKNAAANPRINANGNTYIYIAIRRGPMRAPTSGTEVFAPYQVPSSPSTGAITGFVTDAGFIGDRSGSDKFHWGTRLTGSETLNSTNTNAGSSNANQIWDRMDGWWNTAINNYMTWGFRRAPGFFDVVAYTGDGVAGRTVSHNLGVAPEMMIVKRRDSSTAGGWNCYHSALGETKVIFLQSTNAASTNTVWNNTAPTATLFTLDGSGVNNSSPYIAYLFATLPGVSKVGSYDGTGGTNTQVIDCGFTSGARFVLLRRYNASGYNWQVFDTERGITSGNDAMLALNTTSAESVLNWGINPNASGFEVTGNSLNETGGSWIYLAIA